MIPWILLGAGIVILDQVAKNLVSAFIGPTDCIHAIPYLIDVVYVKNTGAAFSMFSEGTTILSIISVLFCLGVIVYWIKKKPQHALLKTSLVMLFAGAFGNAIDRILRGFVVDFISTAFMEFPVFNIADISIVIGAILLIVYMTFFEKEESDGKADSSGDEQGQAEA